MAIWLLWLLKIAIIMVIYKIVANSDCVFVCVCSDVYMQKKIDISDEFHLYATLWLHWPSHLCIALQNIPVPPCHQSVHRNGDVI